jgi:hypothetical protein
MVWGYDTFGFGSFLGLGLLSAVNYMMLTQIIQRATDGIPYRFPICSSQSPADLARADGSIV